MHQLVVPVLFAMQAAQAALPLGPSLEVQLASRADAGQSVGRSLHLFVSGNAKDGFTVELVAPHPISGCHPNLVHWASHGPDPSEVLPWQVARKHFPNLRTIPVCGHQLAVELTLVSPVLSPDGTQFASGTLVVTVKHGKRIAPEKAIRP